MADLTLDACDHLIGIWKICYECETTIGEYQGGIIYDCNCLAHFSEFPCVQGPHWCSLESKQQLITNYVKKTFPTDNVKDAYERYMENNFFSLINEINASNVTKEDCDLLMMCWRICYLCETKVEGKTNQSNKTVGWIRPCHCLLHSPSCPVPRVREYHFPSACSLQLKTEIIVNYVKNAYSDDPNMFTSLLNKFVSTKTQPNNVRKAFKTYMKERLPGLFLQELPVFFHSKLAVKKRLGQGAQGVVELVSNNHGLIAVKSYQKGSFCERELANAIKVSNHPNFAQVLGLLYQCPQDKRLNLSPIGYVMEFMPGGSVHDVIHPRCETNRINYSLADVLDWTRQAACALDYLHKRRIIHRDVKPQNMLLSEDHQVLKLCDLGVSNNIQTLGTATAGTISYMAPEVMSTEERVPYTEKCDVYSLAVSIWEMQHRQSPVLEHNLNNLLGLMTKVKNGERPEIAMSCDPQLREMIERGWSSESSQRPSMEEFHTFAVNQLEILSKQKELV